MTTPLRCSIDNVNTLNARTKNKVNLISCLLHGVYHRSCHDARNPAPKLNPEDEQAVLLAAAVRENDLKALRTTMATKRVVCALSRLSRVLVLFHAFDFLAGAVSIPLV
jgi:hypothetical protein